ncbi:hypothetical protein K1T71_014125 [Dendrolimus kikuchii]|uniref:Uncharacterized protein n=1 Tax=Dendrolimus kikuchii TaxID=765133 RepID=A0ACC1CFG8_9NEOP|nr:hypothetical protein K1T71_014125 [Dendrolimus kikuchii]
MADVEDNVDVETKYDTLEEILKSNDPSKMPSTKELLEMLETSNVPEDMKDNLRAMLTGGVPQVFGGYGSILAVLFVLLIFFILLFFGYKLYKSIKDKEKKRQEKKMAKQMKKKK